VKFLPRRRRKPEVIIVALIDIFAILLIFMLMTTQFKEERAGVTIKLPESKTAVAVDQAETRSVILTIAENEALFLDERQLKIDELKPAISELMKQQPPPILALNADKRAPFGIIIQVLDVLKESGVKGNLSAFTEIKK
jgi:biopolymer transport protein ExbD